jgi:hypothetical protein
MKSGLLWASIAISIISFPASTNAQTPARSKGPLVLISGHGNISFSGLSIGGIVGASTSSASKHDQTMEMAQQLLKYCPEVTLTLKQSDPLPDYHLILNRESGESQVMLVRGSDQTVLYANKKGTVARAVREGCKAILSDWRHSTGEKEPESAKKDWWQSTPREAAK